MPLIDPKDHPVYIDYTNHKGKRAWRHIIPLLISYGQSEWHPGKQWLLNAVILDRGGAQREFAMKNIHAWSETLPPCSPAPIHADLRGLARREAQCWKTTTPRIISTCGECEFLRHDSMSSKMTAPCALKKGRYGRETPSCKRFSRRMDNDA
ncbi:MAG: hypothetical protein KKH12_15930 [Gammaproteobacteria bacterium]|nr:hypothetical protein [Gammaproteobacteria bacterium]